MEELNKFTDIFLGSYSTKITVLGTVFPVSSFQRGCLARLDRTRKKKTLKKGFLHPGDHIQEGLLYSRML